MKIKDEFSDITDCKTMPSTNERGIQSDPSSDEIKCVRPKDVLNHAIAIGDKIWRLVEKKNVKNMQ